MTIKQTTDTNIKKYSTAVHNGILNLLDNKKVIILITILHLLAVPLLLITEAVGISSGKGVAREEGYIIVAIGATATAGLLGISIAINNFRYLFKKSEVDMVLSLPISRKHKFLSDYLSGLASYVAPFLASQIISTILLSIFHFIYDGKVFTMPSNDVYGKTQTYTCTIFGEVMPYYFKLVILGFVLMTMLYTITIFVMTCCGSQFEAIFYTILLNTFIPLTVAFLAAIVFGDLYGVVTAHRFYWLFAGLSPAGGAYAGIMTIYSDKSIISTIIVQLVFTAIFFGGAYYLYMKRKAEHVGKPFVFKILYYIIITMIVFCIGGLMIDDNVNILTIIIVTGIIYLILELVTNRGFKKIWQSGIRFALTIGLVCGFMSLSNATNGFGAVTKVPSVDSIDEIAIYTNSIASPTDYNSFNDNIMYYSSDCSRMIEKKDFNSNYYIMLDDKESFALMTDIHKNIVEHYKETTKINKDYNITGYYDENYYNDNMTNYQNLVIAYKLKNGQLIIRSYNELTSECILQLEKLKFTDDYKENVKKNIPENAKRMLDNCYDKSEYEKYTISFSDKWFHMMSESRPYNSMPESFYKEFADAFVNDYMNDTYEKRMTGEVSAYYVRILDTNYAVPYYYNNCMSVFAKYKIEFPKLSKQIYNLRDYNANYNVMKNSIANIYTFDEYVSITHLEKVTSLFTNYALSSLNYARNVSETNGIYIIDEDLFTLLDVAKTGYITDEKCYTIVVGGVIGIIPPEYNDVAERVRNQAGYENNADKLGAALNEYDANY